MFTLSDMVLITLQIGTIYIVIYRFSEARFGIRNTFKKCHLTSEWTYLTAHYSYLTI